MSAVLGWICFGNSALCSVGALALYFTDKPSAERTQTRAALWAIACAAFWMVPA